VSIDGLPSDFPPIRSLDARPNNLPTQLTAFVGRERELDEARELLLRNRLLTLTGPGGTGKTRLSLQLAGSVMEAFPGGMWFVPLASVTDPSLVLATIAHTVGIPETPGRRPLDALVNALAGKPVLLVLDNLEQLVDAAPDLADLLRMLPQLTIVGSSRAVLRISGEQEYAVGGLDIPPDPSRLSPFERERLSDADRRRDPETVGRYEAVRLFVARATGVRPDFALTADNADAVAGICARLGGMPLAIELAAARVRSLPPAAILARLGHQLDLLASGSRDLPERQRSLRAAIAWSHDLLDEPCRKLLERLAVFVGGCTLEDAEMVGGPATELGQDVLDGLGSLVDQSLLRVDEGAGEPRYRMLEPIREFSLERLEANGEAVAIRDRHARRFLEIAEFAAPHLTTEQQRHWLDRLDADLDNLRAALDHVVAAGQTEHALRFVAALWRFWQIRGYLLEGLARAKAVVALPGTEAFPAAHLAGLEALGGLAWWVADYETCRASYEQALEIRRTIGDPAGIAQALYNLSFPLMFGSNEYPRARAMLEEAKDLFVELGDADGEARAWWGLGNATYQTRDLEIGRDAAERAAAHFRKRGMRFDLGWAMYTLGQLAAQGHDAAASERNFREALELFADVDDLSGITMSLDGLATAAWVGGDLEHAARISGAVARLERVSGTGLNSANRVTVAFDPSVLRDDPATAGAWAEGAESDLPRILEVARAGSRVIRDGSAA
jgi:predicted ATPase